MWAPILMYHRVTPNLPAHDPYHNCVTPDEFEAHLCWLTQNSYRSLRLSEVAACFAQTPERARAVLGGRCVAITFDDGYQDNYTFAWPLLHRYNYSATIFLVTSTIGECNRFDPDYEPVSMLNAKEILEMHQGDLEFGSHTVTHPASLIDLPDSEVLHELKDSRNCLEDLLGEQVDQFSYPHSKMNDRVASFVEVAGYNSACAGRGTRFDRYCMHRIEAPVGNGARLGAAIKMQHRKWLIRKRIGVR